METYIQAQGYAIWRKVKVRFAVPADENINAGNMADVEANAKARNIIIQGLSRSEFDRISHLSSAYDIWVTLDAYHEGTTQIKTVRQDQFKREYNKFEMLAGESLDECFSRFHKILSNLRAVGLTYPDSDNARQMLAALDLRVWEMKVTTIKDTTDLSTLTLDALYSRLKTHEIDVVSRRSKSQSMALVTDPSSASGFSADSLCGFSLAALCDVTDDQLEQLEDEQLALLARKFSHAYKRRRDRKRGGPVICFECGGPNHIRANCPKLEKGKNDYGGSGKNDYTDKNRNKKTPAQTPGKKKFRNFGKAKKLFHRVLTAFDDLDLSEVEGWSDDDGTGDQEPKDGGDDFSGMCFMALEGELSDSELYSDSDEVGPTYDQLNQAFLKLGGFHARARARCTELEKQVDRLSRELTSFSSAPSRDDCDTCCALLADLEKLRTSHDSVSSELDVVKVENVSLLAELELSRMAVTLLTTDETTSPTSCEVKDIDAKGPYAMLLDLPESCENCNNLKMNLKRADHKISELYSWLLEPAASCSNCPKLTAELESVSKQFQEMIDHNQKLANYASKDPVSSPCKNCEKLKIDLIALDEKCVKLTKDLLEKQPSACTVSAEEGEKPQGKVETPSDASQPASSRIAHSESAVHAQANRPSAVGSSSASLPPAVPSSPCSSCTSLFRECQYLMNTLERFVGGKKKLNLILDQSKICKFNQGLGYDFYEDMRKHPPAILRPILGGMIEVEPRSEEVKFKSAGFVQGISDSKVSPPAASASQKAKPSHATSASQKAKYHCTFCQKDGHTIDRCFRRARIAQKDRVAALRRIQGQPQTLSAPNTNTRSRVVSADGFGQHRGLGFSEFSGFRPHATPGRDFRRPQGTSRFPRRDSYPRHDQQVAGVSTRFPIAVGPRNSSRSTHGSSASLSHGERRVDRGQSCLTTSSARRIVQYWLPKSLLIYPSTETLLSC